MAKKTDKKAEEIAVSGEQEKIDFAKIEQKWQKRWEEKKIFEVKEDAKKKKYYVLEMFPYPSAEGLHIGHALNYTIGDIFARFKRMQGFNVLHPMGYDALGLPAENAAIKVGMHPKKYTDNSTANFMLQQKMLGLTYDWTRTVNTAHSDYYSWDQWLFLKMFEKGLAFKKKAPVNWCVKCNSVLANEQVHNGKCWRHEDTAVEIKHLEQWFFKTTKYADELYEGIDKLKNWPERTKAMQKNWIGKSFGTEINFEINGDCKNINCVIVHGCPSNSEKGMDAKTRTYDKHWMPWVKRELEKKGVNVSTPLMPEPWSPNYSKWKKEFEKSNINENSILIGHSGGAGFLVRWLGETKKRIKKLILVAPYLIDSGVDPELKDLVNFKIDSKLKEYCDDLIVFLDKKDDAEIIKSVDFIKSNLGGRIIELPNHGHFTLEDMRSEEFPELLNEIIGNETWPIFTTRADTIYGVTFVVVSAQHPKLMGLVTKEQKKEVEAFLKRLKGVSEKEGLELEKEGVFTGSYAINPLTNEKVPVWAGNFVVADYGCGMVMAVPAHDQRDFEFAKKYNIPIKAVIMPVYGSEHKGEEFRRTISAVVHRKRDNKFLQIRWNSTKWISPVVGGIEENEEIEKAAEREVLEETGYKTKFIKKLGGEFEAHFYNELKKVWRYRRDQPVLLELIDETPVTVNEKEKSLHLPEWKSAEEILKETTHEYNNLGLLRYLGKEQAYTADGRLVNSEEFNGWNNREAIEEIAKLLEKKKLGKKVVNFKLRDWLISRQRYWGTPIPVVYCEKCGIVPVPEKELPVELPEKVKFGEGNPLLTNKEWIEVKCYKCGGKAKRETDTMDTFVNSSWYFLRYCDANNEKKIFDEKKANYWCPIDMYIGGAEHACMHLIYVRYYTKFMRDLGLIKLDEPAVNLFHQGMLHGEDGSKMSKSKGNVINPIDIIKEYSADSLRLALMSFASPDKDTNWDKKVLIGSYRFLSNVHNYFEKVKIGKADAKTESKLNSTLKEVSERIENMSYNLAIIRIRELFSALPDETSKEVLEGFVKMLSLFCPHIAEELWEKIGGKGFVSLAEWPKVDESKIDKKFEEAEKNAEKVVSDILNVVKIVQDKKGKDVEKVYLYVMPKEVSEFNVEEISRKVCKEVKVFAVNDKAKYDPEGKSAKAKPGKPGIYVE